MTAKLFLAQRVTAAILAFVVVAHLSMIIAAEHAGLTAGAILARTHHNLVLFAFYALFVVAAAIHAPIGLRNVIAEWTGWRGRSLDLAMGAFAVALATLGLRAAFAVYSA
ncbi:MAG: succinate dehydrogenase [Hyphomicrobiales bacterium]|nr:succinate dehydrogenase [Hyphomicrobiales bacterium]MBV9430535.1 succinate dehydrogenase [Hyphomicrobiales bacterium]MBV9738770.1 succinate dehydrogenase [Hyphomicrobiales bacterium]